MSEEGREAGNGTAGLLEAVEALIAAGGAAVPADQRLYAELTRLALLIRQAKHEIAGLGAGEINSRFIPEAKDELEAVIESTESAADAILDAAETIETEAGSLAPETAAPIRAAVTRIYEACNFQDITGQRIKKVVRTLQDIEARVLAVLGPAAAAPPAPAAAEEARLENGPQLAGAAQDQAAIDALLKS